MFQCANCGTMVVLGGKKYAGYRFCSQECADWARHPGFCKECLAATTDHELRGTFRFNGFGTQLAFPRRRCRTCGSVVQNLAISILFLPLVPLVSYRVRWASPERFVARRLGRPAVILRPQVVRIGPDLQADVRLTGAEAAAGIQLALDLSGFPQSRDIVRVRVPAGVQDGTRIRLAAKGLPAVGRGARGDLYVRVQIDAADGRPSSSGAHSSR
jgi:hypothetical protein